MKLNALRPILWSDQFNETILFYTTILGFGIAERNDDWGWAALIKDEVGIMISKPNQHTAFDKPLFTGSFYFNTNDVDCAWEELKDKARVAYPIENFDWGMREFAIYDNNDYILQFGQNVEA